MQERENIYKTIKKQVAQLAETTPNLTALLANTAALLHEGVGFWWTGFYTVSGSELILGAFQGPVACTRIGYGKGVCGTAWKERKTVTVRDVEEFPGHIACSSESRSEIVVPLTGKEGEVWGVLDIDSEKLGYFSESDEKWLDEIGNILSEYRETTHSPIGHICLAGGCFWGLQHYLDLLPGVCSSQVGFANGNTKHPTYEEVYTDGTGFAEAVAVTYDKRKLSLTTLLEMFFKAIDPTSLNKQGEDRGTRYRTGIYYTDHEDLPAIRRVYDQVAGKHDGNIAVELKPLDCFYAADEYHQQYREKNPAGYCHLPLSLFAEAKAMADGKKAQKTEYQTTRGLSAKKHEDNGQN